MNDIGSAGMRVYLYFFYLAPNRERRDQHMSALLKMTVSLALSRAANLMALDDQMASSDVLKTPRRDSEILTSKTRAKACLTPQKNCLVRSNDCLSCLKQTNAFNWPAQEKTFQLIL